MKVFLIWSGTASHAVAEALRGWIPLVLQRVQPFFSSEDIRKGARWQAELGKQLSEVQFAIICLTAENLEARWVHFEAGAVSKHVETSRVTALLFGIEAADVRDPLNQFQHTIAAKGDVKKLMQDLNKALGADALQDAVFEETFEAFWPRLHEKLEKAKGIAAPKVKKREPEEMLTELLELARENNRSNVALIELQRDVMALSARTPQPLLKWISEPGALSDPEARELRNLLIHGRLLRSKKSLIDDTDPKQSDKPE